MAVSTTTNLLSTLTGLGGLAAGTTIQAIPNQLGYWTATTGTNDYADSLDYKYYSLAYPTNNIEEVKQRLMKTIYKFRRLFEDTSIEEGSKYVEPLDELRVKVSKWLKLA